MAGGINFSRVESVVFDLAAPIAKEQGLYIYDVEYTNEGGKKFLRIFVDVLSNSSENGRITMDECEGFSRAFNAVVDKSDPISENYFLEVSSPGIERKVRRKEHFEINKGETVDVGLYKAVNGSKILIGELVGLDEADNVQLIVDGEDMEIPLKQTTMISVHFEF